MGVVPAATASTPRSRRIAHAHGALLIMDEVMTGFRVSRAGWHGLDAASDADLFTFGKVMGGGLPAAAFGGRADVMAQLAPAGPVYQAGTLSGNPLACAAGLATLRLRRRRSTQRLDDDGRRRGQLASDALAAAGRAAPAAVRGQHVLDLLHRRRRASTTTAPAPRTSPAFKAFFHAMLAARRLPAAERVRGVVRLGRASTTPLWSASPPRCRTAAERGGSGRSRRGRETA